MVILSAAQQRHRSRISYACGLLALVGVATALVAMRDPAHSSTELATPVPVPASEFPPTEAESTTAPPGHGRSTGSDQRAYQPADPVPVGPGNGALSAAGSATTAGTVPGPRDTAVGPRDTGSGRGTGGGSAALAGTGPDRPETPPAAQVVRSGSERRAPAEPHRSLLWSGLLGLSIALTGLVMVGRRRRMW